MLGHGEWQNCQVLEMEEPSEITYSDRPLLPVGKRRLGKDGDMARVTEAELQPGVDLALLQAWPRQPSSTCSAPLGYYSSPHGGAASTSRILLQFRGT